MFLSLVESYVSSSIFILFVARKQESVYCYKHWFDFFWFYGIGRWEVSFCDFFFYFGILKLLLSISTDELKTSFDAISLRVSHVVDTVLDCINLALEPVGLTISLNYL